MKKWTWTGLAILVALNLWAANSSRYVDNGDGTVTDCVTGLMWTKDANHGLMDWYDAGRYCDNLDFAGYSDWRLPSETELNTLFRADGKSDGAWQGGIGRASFVGVQGNGYWSGTPSRALSGMAYGRDMFSGRDGVYDYTENGNVWPVRGGQ